MVQLVIFDTRLKKKVPLIPERDNTVRMYTCGPTVYNYAHIGNLRTYVFEDILRRTILAFGMKVNQVMNLTDVDDKTIQGANREKVPLRTFTERYKIAFFADLAALHVQKVEKYTAATDYVDQMIEIIQGLLDKGVAYPTGYGNIFFRIDKFPAYGSLSHFCIQDLKAGASMRVTGDEYDKENICDFVLWKAYDPDADGDVVWDAPWGRGRPGWHIECSAMAMHCLGETIDLHVGGQDNIFPHHENEIAQSEAYTGKVFARHWMHSAHLIVDGKKMSKSLGNFFVLNDLLKKGFSGREIRYLLMSTHYRMQLNFTVEGLEGAQKTLRRIDDFIDRLEKVEGIDGAFDNDVIDFEKQVFAYFGDDLNISGALGVLFDFIRSTNGALDQNKVGKIGASNILNSLKKIDQVLGVMVKEKVKIPEEIEAALVKRNAARKNKDYALADHFRKKIEDAGFIIEDAPAGSFIKRK